MMKNSQFIRFAIVGVLATSIDFALYTLFANIFHLNPGLASAASFFISANLNFNLNNIITFHNSRKTYWAKLGIFYIVAAGGVLLSFLFTNFFINLSFDAATAKLITIVIVLMYNYFLHSFITFK